MKNFSRLVTWKWTHRLMETFSQQASDWAKNRNTSLNILLVWCWTFSCLLCSFCSISDFCDLLEILFSIIPASCHFHANKSHCNAIYAFLENLHVAIHWRFHHKEYIDVISNGCIRLKMTSWKSISKCDESVTFCHSNTHKKHWNDYNGSCSFL